MKPSEVYRRYYAGRERKRAREHIEETRRRIEAALKRMREGTDDETGSADGKRA